MLVDNFDFGIRLVRRLHKLILAGWQVESIRFRFNPSAYQVDCEVPESWPLYITFVHYDAAEPIQMRILSAKAGYHCAEADMFINILSTLGADYTVDDIYTRKHMNRVGTICMDWKHNDSGRLVLQTRNDV